MKKEIISTFILTAILFVVSSCEEKEPYDELTTSKIGINVNLEDYQDGLGKSTSTRAARTTTESLNNFTMTAFISGRPNYIENVKYTKSGSDWKSTAGTFFWPKNENVNFYAYSIPSVTPTVTINQTEQIVRNFYKTGGGSTDFIYAKTTGNAAQNENSGITLNFRHALSRITVSAINNNRNYSVHIYRIYLDNGMNTGDFHFPSPSDDAASWSSLSYQENRLFPGSLAWSYDFAYDGNDYYPIPGYTDNIATWIVMPQQLVKATKASDGSCLKILINVLSNKGESLYYGYAYVGLDTNLEMGKQYNYVLNFSNGVGQKEDGTPIKLYTLEGIYDSNSIIIDPSSNFKYYGINITRANTFWSNPSVGDANNVINANTEWTADVVWQDIRERAINFCDAKGNVVTSDTYDGKGTSPLYIKAANNVKGNVVVGIKKKGSSDYLWSWHLWLSDEPREIATFMDRNLGATSATPSDGNKTYGLYYQFGRKDPFVGDIDIYDINGNKKQTGSTIGTGKVTFAKAVSTPSTFYTYGINTNVYDWASPNNYTAKNWNDITGATGKTFFDPCPTGWKLPEINSYAGFSSTNFILDATNNGGNYNYNWFPFAASRSGLNGVMADFDGGYYFSSSPANADNGYILHIQKGLILPYGQSPRSASSSIRCIRE